jgi:hypothetical protein
MVLASILDTLARKEEGLTANAEAVALLGEPFFRLPFAFADLMSRMARDYLGRCEALGRTPDTALLDPIVAAFQQLQTPQEKPK